LAGKGPTKRREFFYWTDDGNLAGLRYDQNKAVFMEQRAHGLEVWMQPLVPLRAPKPGQLLGRPGDGNADERKGGQPTRKGGRGPTASLILPVTIGGIE